MRVPLHAFFLEVLAHKRPLSQNVSHFARLEWTLDSVNTEVDSPLVKIPAYCEDVGTCRTRRSRPDWSGLGSGGVGSQAYDWAGLGRGVFFEPGL
jgi:hypothetical protein